MGTNPRADWSPAQANQEIATPTKQGEDERSPASPKDSGRNDDSTFDDGTNNKRNDENLDEENTRNESNLAIWPPNTA